MKVEVKFSARVGKGRGIDDGWTECGRITVEWI
jgi:hypothetical protein